MPRSWCPRAVRRGCPASRSPIPRTVDLLEPCVDRHSECVQLLLHDLLTFRQVAGSVHRLFLRRVYHRRSAGAPGVPIDDCEVCDETRRFAVRTQNSRGRNAIGIAECSRSAKPSGVVTVPTAAAEVRGLGTHARRDAAEVDSARRSTATDSSPSSRPHRRMGERENNSPSPLSPV